MHYFSLTLLWCCTILLAALLLLDNYLEVYLWQSCESSVSQRPNWDKEKKCAMETALQYCKGESGQWILESTAFCF